MFGGFLGGLISTAAEDMQAERDKVRADEDRVLASKKAYLDDLVKGVQEGRVRPEIYLQALKDSMAASTPAGQRKRSKGGKGFMGGTDSPHLTLLEMIIQGRDPIKELTGGSGAGATPQKAAPDLAPPRTGPAPPPSVMDSAIAPQLRDLGQPVPETVVPPPPRLPGTGSLTQAGRDATDEVVQGVATSWPSFLISPEEQARNEAVGGAKAKIAATEASMPALTKLLGPDGAQRAVMGSYGVSMPTSLKDYQTFVNASGTAARTAIEPGGGRVFAQDVRLPTGEVLAQGSPVTAGWGPQTSANRIFTATSDDGTVTGISGSGQILWRQPGVGRSTPPDRPYYAQALDENGIPAFWRIDPNSPVAERVQRPGGSGLEAVRPTVTDPNPGTGAAKEQQRIIDKLWDSLAVTDSRALLDPMLFKDQEAKRLYGRSYDEILQAAGGQTQTPRGTSVPPPPRSGGSVPKPTQGEPAYPQLVDQYITDPENVAAMQAKGYTKEEARELFIKDPGKFRASMLAWWKQKTGKK